MRQIIGYYNADGYRITDPKSGEDLYTAGNSPFDSTAVVERAEGLSLDQIRAACERTGLSMAHELKAKFIGAEEEEES